MMVANSFDLWQNDVFFSAAEEVQQSADIMESAYRLWIKEKNEGRVYVESDDLCKELQAALSTAKWQLEEFERAVRLSHGHCRDDTTLTRHKQFVTAIENQIYRVESALQEALSKNGKQPMRWVDLNKEERDDLAMFLSGSSQTSESLNSESSNLRDSSTSSVAENPRGVNSRRETRFYGDSPDCVIDIDERGSPESADAIICVQADKKAGTRRTWSSPNVPNISALRINVSVDAKEEERKKLLSQIEATPKEKGSKPLFWMQRYRDYNQFFDKVGSYQRRFRVPFSRRIQLILSLTLILFLLCFYTDSCVFGHTHVRYYMIQHLSRRKRDY
ncbi:syntaxin t-snare family protein [Arabis alpina]|uniref:Syntaxin t-snare family protein n=1 Tax=Arabis alpina TaxID=50452 RepID=A0A087GI79_ARAAL|nr:syntaxin t-snare family protein [Arabis alpina]